VTGAKTAARFRDAHTHLSAGAADLLDGDLRGARSVAALRAALAAAASHASPGRWIRAWGWDGALTPTDPSSGHPVFLARRDGHAAWVNRAARAALGLPEDRTIVDEAEFDAARARLPERTRAERLAAIRPRLAELVAAGVAAVDDIVEPWGPDLYATLRDRAELPLAVGMWLPESLDDAEADGLRRAFPPGDPVIATAGIKIFLDGSLAARTAALSRPYADDAGNAGTLRIPEGEIAKRVLRWTARGWPVALHAIGDRAVTLALDVLECAKAPAWGAHRIEHAQVVRRSDFPRFARAGVVASVQPGHFHDDLGFLAARLGDRPEVVAHPLRSFARFGARAVIGSDWPVSDWNPAAILAAAGDPARGEEAVDAAQALAWYTSGPR
jgi:predicted amidohydrolase YtcJ